MKLTKRLLAMALAGVMLLTILTGCSGGKTGDRLVEEYMATFISEIYGYGDIPITHDVPEIKAVAEKFDPSLLASDGIGFNSNIIYSHSVPDSLLQLKNALAKYSSCISVYLYAMEVPDGMSELTQVTLLKFQSGPYVAYSHITNPPTTPSSIKCASTLVKKGGKQYRLVVYILVPPTS